MDPNQSALQKRLQQFRFDKADRDPFSQIVAQLPQDWVCTDVFNIAAGSALKIPVKSPLYAPIVQLFGLVKLDHQNPWHWPLLVAIIAWIIIEKGKGPGAPKKWTREKIAELGEDLKSVKLSNNASHAAKRLQQLFPAKYKQFKLDYLRKIIPHARLLHEIGPEMLAAFAGPHDLSNEQLIQNIASALRAAIENEKKQAPLLEWASKS